MGLFGLKKYDERIKQLEDFQKNTELMIQNQEIQTRILDELSKVSNNTAIMLQVEINRATEVDKERKEERERNREKEIEKEKKLDEEKKLEEEKKLALEVERENEKNKEKLASLTAAYALNMCTVSVSQIIDYDDLFAMEQEYEMILNNLNIENMPKDDALLKIFKQLMDTITYFRIYNEDKKRIGEKYKREIKNAIWSSIPSFNVFISGAKGGVWAAAATAVFAVGSSYMNYRKKKAEIREREEEEEWKLQRSAIEQISGLRRELFDTAWRLSDHYGINECYRLTEKQITQFNYILLDPEPLRKYERLDRIKTSFEAYPPFKYYLANAAHMVALIPDNKEYITNKYNEIADKHYQEFIYSENKRLLRQDMFLANACVEYICLLDADKNREKILELIDMAIKASLDDCEILQICAINYLKISEINKAVGTLKILVNEQYNTVMNAQILSQLYVMGYLEGTFDDAELHYNNLKKLIPVNYLVPFPKINDNPDKLCNEFIALQKENLVKKYIIAINDFVNKYIIAFNKCLPLPLNNTVDNDDQYLDSDEIRASRLSRANKVFHETCAKKIHYVSQLQSADIFTAYLDVLEEMATEIQNLPFADSNIMDVLVDSIKSQQESVEECVHDLSQKTEKYTYDNFKKLFAMNFYEFTKKFFEALSKEMYSYLSKLCDMESIVSVEGMLIDFCRRNNLKEPRLFYDNNVNADTAGRIIPYDILGEDIVNYKKKVLDTNEMAKIFEEFSQKILSDKNVKDGYEVRVGSEITNALAKYGDRKEGKKLSVKAADVIGILESKTKKDNLIFTNDSIVHLAVANFYNTKYDKVTVNSDEIILEGRNQKNKNINHTELQHMIRELLKLTASDKEDDSQKIEIKLANSVTTWKEISETQVNSNAYHDTKLIAETESDEDDYTYYGEGVISMRVTSCIVLSSREIEIHGISGKFDLAYKNQVVNVIRGNQSIDSITIVDFKKDKDNNCILVARNWKTEILQGDIIESQ